jgi:mannose-6-phosphate isomerase-like protein (cupin superfamily)
MLAERKGVMTIRHDTHRPASERLADSVVCHLTSPAIHLDGGLLEETARERGGYAVLVPAPRFPFQPPLASPMFFGVTCEVNSDTRESHHFHPHQVEVYCVTKGLVRIRTWLGLFQRDFVLKPGDALVVPPGSCHHLCEWIEPGVCYVFRSPNDITGDAAKILCDGSVHARQSDILLKAA